MEYEYQPYEDAKHWTELNKPIDLTGYDEEEEVYVYPHHEIFLDADDYFLQTRSGPNWQGDCFTLTTCKQFMRTWKPTKDWEGVWFCGLVNGSRKILYLARVGKSFESNYDLGQYVLEKYGEECFLKKSAGYCTMGDLFTPKTRLKNNARYVVNNFVLPRADHTRSRETYSDGSPKWWKDIKFRSPQGRPPSVFIFEKESTFLYSNYHAAPEGKQFNTGRSGCKLNLKQFKELLNEKEKT